MDCEVERGIHTRSCNEENLPTNKKVSCLLLQRFLFSLSMLCESQVLPFMEVSSGKISSLDFGSQRGFWVFDFFYQQAEISCCSL